ncbi:MAG: hypothetical protein IH881_18535, partial [Myxococcales bacterium]|nr:hypothetical protein [Myxococcales bacterium]
ALVWTFLAATASRCNNSELAGRAILRAAELDPKLSLKRAELAMSAFVSSENIHIVLALLGAAGLH